MKTNNPIEWAGCTFSAVLTAVQTEHIFQIISLVLTCIATVVTLAFTLYKWYKAAKADGKITKEEIEEAVEIIKDGVEEIKDNIESSEKDEEGENK